MTCSPEQIRILTKFVRSHGQRVAAAKAGMSLSTAKRYLRMNGKPKEKTHKPRSWRTRSDPFAEVVDGGINAQQIGRQMNFTYQKERAAGYGSPFLLVF